MSADCLIFISGWASGSSCWDAVVRKIDRPVSCLHVNWWDCLNTTGEGNALLRFLEREEDRLTIVGWSLGTLVALEGVLQRPMNVKTLVLVSGTARMTSEGIYPGADARVLRAMRARFRRAPQPVLEEFGRLCIGGCKKSSKQVNKFVKTFVDQAGCLNDGHLEAGLKYLQEKDLRTILPDIKVPVYLLHGDCDRIIPIECARYLEKTLPEAHLSEIRGGSHALPYTDPDCIAELVKELIDADFDSQ